MRKKPQKTERAAAAVPVQQFSLPRWVPFAILAALLATYAPALTGPPVCDDNLLPVFQAKPPSNWWRYFFGGRPLYYLSFHLNYVLAGQNTLLYHLTNVLLHALVGWLVHIILRRVLELTGSERKEASLLALFGSLVYLFHPVQTESVAYIASRSECLSTLCAYGALALLLSAGEAPISWKRAIGILGLLATGTLVKEHVVAMAAVLIVVDWRLRAKGSFAGLKRNWRLHAPMVIGAAVAAPAIVIYVTNHSARSAGLGVADTTWYRYLFTQFEAIWIYIRLFVFPVNQALDYNLETAGSFFELQVLLGLAGLVALLYLTWRYRARYPLAALGLVVFLLLLAPTSSVIPIADAAAERRVYLPAIGLLLIVVEGLRHWRSSTWKNALLGVLILLMAVVTRNYCQAFSSETKIWEHTIASKPDNLRARVSLGGVYIKLSRCADAIKTFETIDAGEHAAKLGRNAYLYYVNFAAALECQRQYDRAEQMYRSAIEVAPGVIGWARLGQISPVARSWARLAILYLKQGRWDDALEAQKQAAQASPRFDFLGHSIRGSMYLNSGRYQEAAAAFQQALQLRPEDPISQDGLAKANEAMRRNGMLPPQ